MTTPSLRERLSHLVLVAEDGWMAANFPTTPMPPVGWSTLGLVRPMREVRGFPAMPPGYADVWLHAEAAARREAGVLAEASRQDVDETTFETSRLDHLASWGYAQLDPPHPDEQADYSEAEARVVALAALRHEGLDPVLLGRRLLFCRYTFESTRHQPVWLALFLADEVKHLLIINADTDRLLEPLHRA